MGDDGAIIERVLAGDRDSFRLLVRRYEQPVFRQVRNLLGNSPDAEDVAQDVFLAAYRALASFDPDRSSFGTWLLTIARNRCRNVRAKRTPALLAELPEPVDRFTPEAAAVRKEFFERLDAGLAELPFEQRTVFVLAEIEGLPLAEIGRIEGVALGTVKSRLSRAREKLRSLIDPAEELTR